MVTFLIKTCIIAINSWSICLIKALLIILLLAIHAHLIGNNKLQIILIKENSKIIWQNDVKSKIQQQKIKKFLNLNLTPLSNKIFWPKTIKIKNLQPTLNGIYEITNQNILAGKIKRDTVEWSGVINGTTFQWKSTYSNISTALFAAAKTASKHINSSHFVKIKILHSRENFSSIMNKLNNLCKESFWQVTKTNDKYIYLEGNSKNEKCYLNIGEKVA